jgi:hypothetical protein
MPVPTSEIEARVDEVYKQIDKDFNSWRREGTLTGTVTAVLGYMNNQWLSYVQQTRVAWAAMFQHGGATGVQWITDVIAKAAQFGYAVTKVPFVSMPIRIPMVNSVVALLKFPLDKLIERRRKKQLLAAFESAEPDSDELQMQTEYVAVTLAETVQRAIRKVEAAQRKANDTYNEVQKQKNCKAFVELLTACQYLQYRVDRLDKYNDKLHQWVESVSKAVDDLHKGCEDLGRDTESLARVLVSNYEPHLNCPDQRNCLFKPDWMQYFVVQQRPGAVVPTPSPTDTRYQRVGQPSTPGSRPPLPTAWGKK